MKLPTPLLIIPPGRRVFSLPLQPPHQLPQESFIPAILRRNPSQHHFLEQQSGTVGRVPEWKEGSFFPGKYLATQIPLQDCERTCS